MEYTNPAKFYWGNLTWVEIKEAIAQQRVILMPIGATEQHGRHLPLNTDNFIANHLCLHVAQKIPEEVLILPVVPFAFNQHHLDFPGTIAIKWQNILGYLIDVVESVAYHGFKRMIFVSGHGVNPPYMAVVANEVNTRFDALCVSFVWTALLGDISDIRESEFPGGMAHACELETSVFLYLDQERVRQEEIVKEMSFENSSWLWMDLVKPSPLHLGEMWWSSFSKTGVAGDATLATAEKGQALFERATENFIQLIREFRARELPIREDFH